MKTVQAEEKGVSIWLSGEKAPTRELALAMVRQALEERGLVPWGRIRVEIFAAGEDALILARPETPDRRAFFFPDLETLLAGTENCPGVGGSLYRDGRAYILTVQQAEEHPGLYEFGDLRELSPDWECHAREQGMCLLPDSALDDLRRHFATGCP